MQIGKTYLQIVNAVLYRLREAAVADFSSPTGYTQLIMDLVNQIKVEIEDAYPWQALRDTYTITTADDTVSYAFSGAGSRAYILQDQQGRPKAWNSTQRWRMMQATEDFMDEQYNIVSPTVEGSPTHFVENGLDASYDLKIDVWPQPTGVETLTFNMYVPQDPLSATTDVPKIPVAPLIEGVLWRAIMERGDDGGDSAQAQYMIYQRMLSDAVAVEAHRLNEYLTWKIV